MSFMRGVAGRSLLSRSFTTRSFSKPTVGFSAPVRVSSRSFATQGQKKPVKVAITGAAGQIGYALTFRVASGHLLGPDQPVILQLIELPHALDPLKGVVMELDDCAFPLVHGIQITDSIEKGFEDIDYALLVGSKPRKAGMERGDLLTENGKIFAPTGQALNKFAKKTCKTIVVGNPANTNCLIAANNAPDIPPENFTAMTRLDHNRALSQLSTKTNTHISKIHQIAIWGNHSATQYPDVNHGIINGRPAKEVINDEKWIKDTFIPAVQQRGAAVIKARGASSAASAANGCLNHIHDWVNGSNGEWVSMAIPSDGSYGVEKGVYYSYPVICKNGKYEKVQGLKIDSYSAQMMEKTKKELFEERDMVKALLPN